MNKETIRNILSGYMLIKGVLGLIGTLLFMTGTFTITTSFWYFTYIFGDTGLFRVTVLLPLLLAALALFAYYAIKKDLGYARILIVIALVPDLFFFPLGTIISIIMIGLSFTKIPDFKPMSNSDRPYRMVGAGIIVVSLVFIFFSSGMSANFTSSVSPSEQSVQVLDASLENATGPIDVIIQLAEPPATMQTIQVQEVFMQDVEQMGGVITDSYVYTINAVRATVSGEDLAALASNPLVASIVPNKVEVWAPNEDILNEQQTVQLLDTSSQLLLADQLWRQNITGKGIVVAVVDTGINSKLPIFQRTNALGNTTSIVIDSLQLYGEYVYWHGTAVASCIASQNITYRGIAPGVDLLNVEVFQNVLNPYTGMTGPGALTSDILHGWDWVAKWKAKNDRIVICCNSLGAPAGSYGANNLDLAAKNMVLINNIPMIVAAGNGNPTTPSSLKTNSPGTAREVLTVGAVDKANAIAYFSCRGQNKPDVVAPGVEIHMYDEKGRQKTASGTSFATPLTAGVCALIAQQHPDFSAKQLQDAIKLGTQKAIIPHAEVSVQSAYGNGLVDAISALAVSNGQKPETSQSYTLLIFPVLGIIILLYPEIKKFKM
jgi:subtilisin family serine protease